MDKFDNFEEFKNDWLYGPSAFDKPKFAYEQNSRGYLFFEVFGEREERPGEYYVKNKGWQITLDYSQEEARFTMWPVELSKYNIFDSISEMYRDIIEMIF